MNEDFNQKLKQLTEMLGKEGMPDNISGLLSMLANSSTKEQSGQKVKEEMPVTNEKPAKEEKPESNDFQDNVEMVRKMKGMMDNLQNLNDPRINLLTAIRPFLSKSRQKKVGNCIRLFQMTYLSRFFVDNDKSI